MWYYHTKLQLTELKCDCFPGPQANKITSYFARTMTKNSHDNVSLNGNAFLEATLTQNPNNKNSEIIAPDSPSATTSQHDPISNNDYTNEVPATPIPNDNSAVHIETPTADRSMLDPDADHFRNLRNDVYNMSPVHSSDFSSPIQRETGDASHYDAQQQTPANPSAVMVGTSLISVSTPNNIEDLQHSSDEPFAPDNSAINDTVQLDLSITSRGSLASGFTPSDRGPDPGHVNRNRLKRLDVSNVGTCPTGHSIVGDMLNLVFAVIGTWKCPLINSTANYGGDPWCAYCQSNTTHRPSNHGCFQDSEFIYPDGNAPPSNYECVKCGITMPSRIGIISHRRKHKNQEKKEAQETRSETSSAKHPTLDEFSVSASGSAPSTNPSATSNNANLQDEFNAATDALFNDLDFEATQETGDPEVAYFPKSRIPKTDAASPSKNLKKNLWIFSKIIRTKNGTFSKKNYPT